ncbi:MAG TPA: YigZ family protein [Bacilli bacterium]
MIDCYKSVGTIGRLEIVVKKSRFIGYAKQVVSEEQAVQFIEQVKKEHSGATHNCSAYLVGERDEFQKQSDDGEPSGTAGRPIMEVIKNKGLSHIVVVVTRYFGGIMLGAGGLVRAYTETAAAGIEAAGVVHHILHEEIYVEIDYTWLGRIENELRVRKVMVGDHQFTDKVIVACLPLSKEADGFVEWMTDLTQGQGAIRRGFKRYVVHSQPPWQELS